MSYQVLARKWRPRCFADMVGQGHVLKALKNALDSERLHHAYLFTGTRGVGKTTLARILAKCLNCETGVSATPCGSCAACVGIDEGRFVDLIEVDAASRAKVEETRDLMDNVSYAPSVGRFKVYLIDEVHMFSRHSFNALLKTLEEPPPHVKFLLATTEPKKLPVTILSRCLQFNLKHLSKEQIAQQLASILEQEDVATEKAANSLIAAAANGSMRDALSLLDQAIAYGNGELRQARVREMLGTVDSTELHALLATLAAGDAQDLLQRLDKMAEHTPDYDAVLAELLSALHDVAVAQTLGQDAEIVDEETQVLAEKMRQEDVQLFYQIALTGRRDLAMSPDPRIGFEMTMIRMLAFKPAARVELPSAGPSAKSSAGPSGGSARSMSAAKDSALEGRSEQPMPAVAEASASFASTRDAGDTQGPEQRAGQKAGQSAAQQAAISGDWQQMIDALALSGLTKELAGHCVLKAHSQEKIHLVLTPAHGHLLNTTQKARLQKAIHTRFGSAVKLLITVAEPSAETPAQMRDRQADERQKAAAQSFEKDAEVRAMLETFDGTLDRDSIRAQ